jgi:hypothetical protein
MSDRMQNRFLRRSAMLLWKKCPFQYPTSVRDRQEESRNSRMGSKLLAGTGRHDDIHAEDPTGEHRPFDRGRVHI